MSKKTFYDIFFSSGNHHNWRNTPGKLVVLNYFLSNVGQKISLLDIGCGDGYFINKIVDMSAHENTTIDAYGIDISTEAVNLASNDYPTINFIEMDAELLEFQNDKFDWVVSYGVFEHLDNPFNAIKELQRILTPGGKFALMMPTIGSYRNDRTDEGWYEDQNEPPQLQWNYKRKTWEDLFRKAGLTLDEENYAKKYGAINPGNFYFGRN